MPVTAPNPAPTYLSKWFIGDALPISSGNGACLDFVSETFSKREVYRNFQGMSGTVAHAATRTRLITADVDGEVTLNPKPRELAKILRYATGGTPTGSTTITYPLAETIPPFAQQFLKNGRLFSYVNCLCGSLRVQGSYGNPMAVTFSGFGTTESEGAGSGAPALAPDILTAPFVFSDVTLSLAGNTIDVFDFDWMLDNRVQARRANSVTPTAVFRTDRVVTCRLTIPYGDDVTNYNLDPAGVPVVATWTYAGNVFTLSMPLVQFPRNNPPLRDRNSEIPLTLNGTCGFSSASGDEAVITLLTS